MCRDDEQESIQVLREYGSTDTEGEASSPCVASIMSHTLRDVHLL